MTDDELIAMISERVLGYREGANSAILQAVVQMKVKAMKHEQNTQVESLFEMIEELYEVADDIKREAT